MPTKNYLDRLRIILAILLVLVGIGLSESFLNLAFHLTFVVGSLIAQSAFRVRFLTTADASSPWSEQILASYTWNRLSTRNRLVIALMVLVTAILIAH